MGIWLGIARITAHRLLGKTTGVMDEVILDRRVTPFDLDPNMHMTNSVYYTLMDLGRVEHLVYSDLMKTMFRNKLGPAIGGVGVRFRRSLAPFQKYRVITTLKGWDEKWLYYEQRIESDGDAYALGYARLACVGKGKSVPISELMALRGHGEPSPDLGETPEILEKLCRAL